MRDRCLLLLRLGARLPCLCARPIVLAPRELELEWTNTHIAQIPVPVPRSRTFCGEVNVGCLGCGARFVSLGLQWGQNRVSHRGEESRNGDCQIKKRFHDLDLNKYLKSCWSLAASSFGPCQLVNSIQCADYREQNTQCSVEPKRRALFST